MVGHSVRYGEVPASAVARGTGRVAGRGQSSPAVTCSPSCRGASKRLSHSASGLQPIGEDDDLAIRRAHTRVALVRNGAGNPGRSTELHPAHCRPLALPDEVEPVPGRVNNDDLGGSDKA